MSQNREIKVQICRKLGMIVNEALDNAKVLLSVLEELLELYKPKSQEETGKFYSLKFELPYSVRLLCDLLEIDIPDDDETFFYLVIPLRDMTFDVTNRIIGANVIKNDIITMHFDSKDNEINILLYLTMLKSVSNSILFLCDKIDNLRKKLSRQWPELLSQDDDSKDEEEMEEGEDSILPKDVDGFQRMRSFLDKALYEYFKDHDSERISGFISDVQAYLEAFANGIGSEQSQIID